MLRKGLRPAKTSYVVAAWLASVTPWTWSSSPTPHRANPTSNKIYAALGYRPVVDMANVVLR